jgi:hypothetical protein
LQLEQHDGCHYWSRNYLLFQGTCVHPRFIVRFVLLDLKFYVSCFVERCLSFCTFSFGHCVACLFFFDLRILITPLVSSNSSLPILKHPKSRTLQIRKWLKRKFHVPSPVGANCYFIHILFCNNAFVLYHFELKEYERTMNRMLVNSLSLHNKRLKSRNGNQKLYIEGHPMKCQSKQKRQTETYRLINTNPTKKTGVNTGAPEG